MDLTKTLSIISSIYRTNSFFRTPFTRNLVKYVMGFVTVALEHIYDFKTCVQDPVPYRLRMILGLDERETLRLLMAYSTSTKSNILDIGANVGKYSRFFASNFPCASIYSFEPNPDAFEYLLENTRNFSSCHPIPIALGRHSCIAKLLIDPSHSALSSIETTSIPPNPPNRNLAKDVELRHASEYLALIGVTDCSIIKIDVEGFEMDVLLGLRELILNTNRILIIVELNPLSLSAKSVNPLDLFDLLNRYSLVVYESGKYNSIPAPLCSSSFNHLVTRLDTNYTNLICFKGYDKDELPQA